MTEQNNEKEKFTLAYIQQQERYIMEALREKFNLQIQMNNIAESAEVFKRMYDESQNEVAKQNELLRQATVSIEKLTNDLKVCENVSEDRMKLISQMNQQMVELENLKNVHKAAQKEIERLNNELAEYVEDNNRMSKQLDQFVPVTEVKMEVKKPKKKAIQDEDTF